MKLITTQENLNAICAGSLGHIVLATGGAVLGGVGGGALGLFAGFIAIGTSKPFVITCVLAGSTVGGAGGYLVADLAYMLMDDEENNSVCAV